MGPPWLNFEAGGVLLTDKRVCLGQEDRSRRSVLLPASNATACASIAPLSTGAFPRFWRLPLIPTRFSATSQKA